MRLIKGQRQRSIFSTNMLTDESSQNNFARSTQSKEGINYKCVTRKTKASDSP